jgi:Phospholipase_D-nuclease N-terminal
MVAASFIDFFWSILIIYFIFIYFMMLFHVIGDIFRRDDASGGKKALWLIFVLVAPLLGLLIYMISQGDGMAQRNVKQAQRSQDAFDDYVRTTASSGGAAAEIEKGKGLLDSGAISQTEFDAIKAKALSS